MVLVQCYTITARSIILCNWRYQSTIGIVTRNTTLGQGSAFLCHLWWAIVSRSYCSCSGRRRCCWSCPAVSSTCNQGQVVHRRNKFRASDVAGLQALRRMQNAHMETTFCVIQYETKLITTSQSKMLKPPTSTGSSNDSTMMMTVVATTAANDLWQKQHQHCNKHISPVPLQLLLCHRSPLFLRCCTVDRCCCVIGAPLLVRHCTVDRCCCVIAAPCCWVVYCRHHHRRRCCSSGCCCVVIVIVVVASSLLHHHCHCCVVVIVVASLLLLCSH